MTQFVSMKELRKDYDARIAKLETALTRWHIFARDNGYTDADFHTGDIGWISETREALGKPL